MHEGCEHREVVREVCDGVAVEAQELGSHPDRVDDQAPCDRRQRVEAVRQGRRDAEVPAAAPECPEEVGMRVLRHVEDLAVGRDELDRDEVVRGEPVLRHDPAEAAAEGEPGNARRRDRAARDGQPVLRDGVVELAPGEPALCGYEARVGIHRRLLHLCEVDHHRAVRDREPADVVAPAADRDLGARGPREADRRRGVGGRAAADDQRGPPVDHPVVDAPRGLVSVVSREQHGAADVVGQRLELRRIECRRRAHATPPSLVRTTPRRV